MICPICHQLAKQILNSAHYTCNCMGFSGFTYSSINGQIKIEFYLVGFTFMSISGQGWAMADQNKRTVSDSQNITDPEVAWKVFQRYQQLWVFS